MPSGPMLRFISEPAVFGSVMRAGPKKLAITASPMLIDFEHHFGRP
jgi:hypothetical protein